MSLASRARAAFRAFFPPSRQQRGFDGVKGGRLMADWFAHATSGDAEIRQSIRKLIDRSRDLERNNDYQRGFLLGCERNIIGAIRHDLSVDAGEYVKGPAGKPPKWQPDRLANSLIEMAWDEWSKKGTCTVCGRYSWREVKKLGVRGTARDGNFIARKIVGKVARNRFGFALQIWEIDHLDLQKFESRSDGTEIRFGIETDAMKRVTAYWLMAGHPGDSNGATGRKQYVSTRFSAEEIYHLFVSERAEQSVGIPWVVSAITRLRQLGAFEEAAVIAARVGASKVGFFKKTSQEGADFPNGDSNPPEVSGDPGTFEGISEGWELDSWNPEYPNIETGDFRKAMLRGVGTSLGVSYTTLGNDLESVNFSSARVGLFEEREMWKSLQAFFAESFWEPVFSDWLVAAITNGAINLPITKLAKFNRPNFKARRWPFIDPLKEVEAAKGAISLRIGSRRQFIEEGGGDVEDVFHDNLADENLAKEIGLSLAPPDPDAQTNVSIVDDKTKGKKPAADAPEDDEEDDDPEDEAAAPVKK